MGLLALWRRWLRKPANDDDQRAPWYRDDAFWAVAKRERPGDSEIVETASPGFLRPDVHVSSILAMVFERFDCRWQGWVGAFEEHVARRLDVSDELPDDSKPDATQAPPWASDQVFWKWVKRSYPEDAEAYLTQAQQQPPSFNHHDYGLQRMRRRWQGWRWAIEHLRNAP